jgi:N-acetylglutamate synthase-like GNAT family acetyltransferase
MDIRKINAADMNWIQRVLKDYWGSCLIVSRGNIYQADHLPGFIAKNSGENVGLVTYSINNTECEIVTLNSLSEDQGIGTSLLNEVIITARKAGCQFLCLITTNDNLRALRFYQKRGFILFALHPRAVEQSRKLKPEIPEIGYNGIPIRDELELQMIL